MIRKALFPNLDLKNLKLLQVTPTNEEKGEKEETTSEREEKVVRSLNDNYKSINLFIMMHIISLLIPLPISS